MTDYQLIQRYLKDNDQAAFRTLLSRHLNLSKRVVASMVQASHDHDDLVQQSWIKVLNSLNSYKDEQKFSAFLSTIVKNTVKDYWRYSNVRRSTDFFTDVTETNQDPQFADSAIATDSQFDLNGCLDKLLNEYIPQLPNNLRVVFLLKHESEYWDDKQRLDWQTIGVLTGQSAEQAWLSFDLARRVFKAVFDGDTGKRSSLSDRELETFLLWTQSQRPLTHKKVTESDLSELLGIPLNTFKTRYRAAKQKLQENLNNHDSVQGNHEAIA